MLFRFLYVPKPKQFDITPRYYDPVKEEHEDRVRRIKAEMGIRDESDPAAYYRALIKGQFRRQMQIRPKSANAEIRRSNNRLLFLVVILGIVVYLMFYR